MIAMCALVQVLFQLIVIALIIVIIDFNVIYVII